jgi:hypothetical protein
MRPQVRLDLQRDFRLSVDADGQVCGFKLTRRGVRRLRAAGIAEDSVVQVQPCADDHTILVSAEYVH